MDRREKNDADFGSIAVGRKIRIARKINGLSQVELAEKTGVTRQTIGLVEAGRYNPSLRVCVKIAQALKKTLDDLFWVE